jgi:hypothetical protein
MMKRININTSEGWTPYRDGEVLPFGKEDEEL